MYIKLYMHKYKIEDKYCINYFFNKVIKKLYLI